MCQPGPARAERAVPRRLPRPLAAPDDAVERVLLAFSLGIAAALGEEPEHRLAVVAGLVAERRVGRDRVVEVVLDLVDRAGGLEPLDQRDHERDRLHRADERVGRQHPQRLHVLAEQLGLALGELDPVDADLGRPLQQRVVDVGDVLDVADRVPGRPPGPVEQVEGDVGVGVAEVRRVVGRDAADVEPGHVVGRDRHAARPWRCRGSPPAARPRAASASRKRSTRACGDGYP